MDEGTVMSMCAMVSASVACAMIRAMGMQAENEQRKHRGEAMAYTEADFVALIDSEAIGYNSVVMRILH